MIKKTITYTDFDDRKRTEDFYFNFTKSELVEMRLSHAGGLEKLLERIIATEDTKGVFDILKTFVVKSYGVKSDDGRRFIKSTELTDEFMQTEAFSELMLELISGAETSAEFIRGIVPESVAQEAVEMMASNQVAIN